MAVPLMMSTQRLPVRCDTVSGTMGRSSSGRNKGPPGAATSAMELERAASFTTSGPAGASVSTCLAATAS